MTRDELLAWLLLPWNIVKAIALTAWWILAALVRGDDDEASAPVPQLSAARSAGRARRAADPAAPPAVRSVDPPRP